MSDAIIIVENLGKKYRLRHQPQLGQYTALRDVIADKFKRLLQHGKSKNGSPPAIEDFWALRDVSFEIKQGDVVGIIGRNGAGKSTLLKILSRITEPTTGSVQLQGRVASLLEVGTGFHNELTGRENVFLNGAILGMSKAEIKRKFDEIVAFAEVDKFLDTPVKRYSSGMFVRLAFAVAAHLEPEILIVDEVLAVGDAEFQRKCLGKMQAVSKGGRTVLFVSHNTTAVRALCTKGIWLDQGRLVEMGTAERVLDAYGSRALAESGDGDFSATALKGDGSVRLISYRVTNGSSGGQLPLTTQDLVIDVNLSVLRPINQPAFGISIINQYGVLLTCINTVEQGRTMPFLPAGPFTMRVRIKSISYLPGKYTASFWVMNPQCHKYAIAENAIVFEVDQSPIYGTSQVDPSFGCVYSDIDFAAVPAEKQNQKIPLPCVPAFSQTCEPVVNLK
jgi:lipopolysaccharide transport system ATP-binding protein